MDVFLPTVKRMSESHTRHSFYDGIRKPDVGRDSNKDLQESVLSNWPHISSHERDIGWPMMTAESYIIRTERLDIDRVFDQTVEFYSPCSAKRMRLPSPDSALSKTLERFCDSKNIHDRMDEDYYKAVFANYGKHLEQMWNLFANHKMLLTYFVETTIFLYIDHEDDPELLPKHERHYVAMKAAARHKCSYLFSLHAMEFTVRIPLKEYEEWLRGIKKASPEMAQLAELNKFLAHRPWVVTVDHIRDLYNAGLNKKTKLMHAILIMCHTHCLTGLVFAFGLRGEGESFVRRRPFDSNHPITDSDDEAENTKVTTNLLSDVQKLLEKLNSKTVKPDNWSDFRMFPIDDIGGNSDDKVVTASSLDHPQKATSDETDAVSVESLDMRNFVIDEQFQYPKRKNEKNGLKEGAGIRQAVGIELAGIETENENGSHKKYIREDAKIKMSQSLNLADIKENYSEIGMEDMANICASENARHNHRHYQSRKGDTGVDDTNVAAHAEIFDQEIFEEKLRRLCPNEICHLLESRFEDIREMTYGTLGPYKNVDTHEIRYAVWYYVQSLYKLRHEDYEYFIIDKYPEVNSFVRMVCCRPEEITLEDFDKFLPYLDNSEKVHIILIAIEAKLQAQLYYVMRVVDDFLQPLDPQTGA